MFLATLALLAMLLVLGRRQESRAGAGERVDVKRIEKLVSEGKLSIRPAEFGRRVSSPEEAGPE